MPRYFFHLRNDVSTDDEEGLEVPDLVGARDYAIFNARAIAAENVHKGHLDLSHRIEIGDETGAIVDTVTFRDAVSVEG
ncbi:MAG TPA: hypothetical protein VEW25_09650 [Allosphingosinicella sp.]|nr:hypothetical protein [Allosphingosinicella sp.]